MITADSIETAKTWREDATVPAQEGAKSGRA